MRPRCPYIPPPMIVSTEAAFVFRTSRCWRSVGYVGRPGIFVGCSGKDSMISAGVGTDGEAMVSGAGRKCKEGRNAQKI